MKTITHFFLAIITISATYAQLGINADNSAPHSSAQLDVKSTTKAFYPPRMTTAQKNAIVSPQAGAVVFDINLSQLSIYNGLAWVAGAGSGLTLPYNQSADHFSGFDGGLFRVTNTSATGDAVALNGTITGVYGYGIRAMATNTNAFSTGAIYGSNASTNVNGFGIWGYHAGGGEGIIGGSNSGIGVSGISSSGTGVKGESNDLIDGIGVWGNNQGAGFGVVGESISGSGVVGRALGTNPNNDSRRGVSGESSSTTDLGIGVYGSHAGTGKAIHGYTENGTGVSGESVWSFGVKGYSHNGDGVYGISDSGVGGFFSSPSGYALIAATGNVGIGTLTPAAKMDIKGTDYLSHFYYGTNEDTYIRGGKAGSHVLINDYGDQGNVGIGLSNPAYILDVKKRIRIRHTIDGTPDDNTAGIWYNNSANVEGAFSGMKTDSEVGLFLGGNWRFWVNSGGQGYLNGALIQTSDKRLKKDFTILNNSLSNIYKLNGYHFKWIEETRNKELQTGFIAQEVQKIFPELVQTDDKGFLSVNYIGLIPHLLEAVKELKNENNSLKTENNSFKNNQTKLESRIDKMESLLNSLSKNTASN